MARRSPACARSAAAASRCRPLRPPTHPSNCPGSPPRPPRADCWWCARRAARWRWSSRRPPPHCSVSSPTGTARPGRPSCAGSRTRPCPRCCGCARPVVCSSPAGRNTTRRPGSGGSPSGPPPTWPSTPAPGARVRSPATAARTRSGSASAPSRRPGSPSRDSGSPCPSPTWAPARRARPRSARCWRGAGRSVSTTRTRRSPWSSWVNCSTAACGCGRPSPAVTGRS